MVATSNSRQTILDRLKTIPIEAPTAAAIDPDRLVKYDDPVAKFTEIVTHVGAQVHLVESTTEVAPRLAEIAEFTSARLIASLVPEAVGGNFSLAQVDDPHALARLDWAIVPGSFPVAENGAIWVRPGDAIERTMLFLTQHLVIIVSRGEMVMHMHDAYRRLRQQDHFGDRGREFGVFISGPSKTADIEQSLVIGAHGCRTLQIFLTP